MAMTVRILTIASLAIAACAAPAGARTIIESSASGVSASRELPAFLQCVPYARELTGIDIYGDAHTWWKQAEGRYSRGRTPRTGAVMAFRPFANSQLGHVAAVSRVIDSRTVLLRHANWSVPGRIEDNVQAVDVSPGNDWSEVRVWYAPTGGLGTTRWPVAGFIYADKPAKAIAPIPRSFVSPAAPAPSVRPAKPAPSRWANDPIGEIIANARG
jgi:surface antigen